MVIYTINSASVQTEFEILFCNGKKRVFSTKLLQTKTNEMRDNGWRAKEKKVKKVNPKNDRRK
jgi:hypothetical protein